MIRTGVDVIEVERVKVALLRTPSLATRLFTEAELDYCMGRRNPYGPLAARFCAKEAAMKALGKGMAGSRFRDLEVRKRASGEPVMWFTGGALDLAGELGVRDAAISISHTHTVAMAVATFECFLGA